MKGILGTERRRGFLASAFFVLSMVLSAFAAYAAPAVASPSARTASLTTSHDGETVALREGRGGEIVSARRAPRAADGGGNDRLGGIAWTPPALTSIAPRAWVSAFGAPYVAWVTPSHARALLMVFSN